MRSAPEFRGALRRRRRGQSAVFRAGARAGHLLFDLPGYIAHRLAALGLAAVEWAGRRHRRRARSGFFSYRRACCAGEERLRARPRRDRAQPLARRRALPDPVLRAVPSRPRRGLLAAMTLPWRWLPALMLALAAASRCRILSPKTGRALAADAARQRRRHDRPDRRSARKHREPAPRRASPSSCKSTTSRPATRPPARPAIMLAAADRAIAVAGPGQVAASPLLAPARRQGQDGGRAQGDVRGEPGGLAGRRRRAGRRACGDERRDAGADAYRRADRPPVAELAASAQVRVTIGGVERRARRRRQVARQRRRDGLAATGPRRSSPTREARPICVSTDEVSLSAGRFRQAARQDRLAAAPRRRQRDRHGRPGERRAAGHARRRLGRCRVFGRRRRAGAASSSWYPAADAPRRGRARVLSRRRGFVTSASRVKPRGPAPGAPLALPADENPCLQQQSAARRGDFRLSRSAADTASVRRFSDMEVFVEIHENVRGEDVFVIQSTSYPANDHLMELLVTLDALRAARRGGSPRSCPITAMPGKTGNPAPRTPISAKLVANLITTAGADRVLTLDLHAGQIQGFFDIPTDNLFAEPVLVEGHQGAPLRQAIWSSSRPMSAASYRARADRPAARCRPGDHRQAARAGRRLRGDEHHRRCRRAAAASSSTTSSTAPAPCAMRPQALIDSGAEGVYAYVTHGVLSGGAVARVAASPIEDLVITDSIVATEAVRLSHNIRQLTIAPLIAEAILRISEERSVSSLFDLIFAQSPAEARRRDTPSRFEWRSAIECPRSPASGRAARPAPARAPPARCGGRGACRHHLRRRQGPGRGQPRAARTSRVARQARLLRDPRRCRRRRRDPPHVAARRAVPPGHRLAAACRFHAGRRRRAGHRDRPGRLHQSRSARPASAAAASSISCATGSS